MHYFEHDTSAGSDDKILTLRLEHGGAAVDAYWVILEQIYDDESPLKIFGNQRKTQSVSHRLCVGSDLLETWVHSMVDIGLLEACENDPDSVTSERAMQNIERYRQKVETARQNGKKGGRKPKQKPPANQMGTNPVSGRKALKTKTKGLGFDKQNPKPLASGGAAAADAAPPAALLCSQCDVPVRKDRQSGHYECDLCHELFELVDGRLVVWKPREWHDGERVELREGNPE